MARNEHKKVLQQLSEAYQNVINEARSDAALWRDQMEKQPKVSDERWEELQNKKPAPKGRLTMPGDEDRDDTHTLKEMQRDIMNGMTAKESMEGMGIHPANQKSLLAKYMEFSKDFSEGPIETGFEDEEYDSRGYADDEYDEPLHSPYHPDNIERVVHQGASTDPNKLRKDGKKHKISGEDWIRDRKGNPIKRKDFYS